MDKEQQLLTILEIAKIVATERDLDKMIQGLLHCLVEKLDATDAGVLLTYDPANGQLVVKAVYGYDFPSLQHIRLAPGEVISGIALESGQIQLHPTPEAITAARENMSPDNREWFARASLGQSQAQSALSVPLITGQSRVGVLLLENRREPHAFGPSDLIFFQHVADLIALSIENFRLREELQAAQALSEANRLKAELISTLAHEMRTPLTSIKGYSTALLMEEASFSPETQREFLEIIDQECDILQDLIHDLLESSIIDAGFLKLEMQPVLLPRLVRAVVDDMARRSRRHRLVVDFPDNFPLVEADPDRIMQVLRNLLDNALKYSPDGGLVVVRGEICPDRVIISVADQGVGIAPEHLNRLFEKFFRIRSGLGRHVVGSGLGLPIARTIVESHGGQIWAESQLGQGSTFYFTLPLSRPDSEGADEQGGQPYGRKDSGR